MPKKKKKPPLDIRGAASELFKELRYLEDFPNIRSIGLTSDGKKILVLVTNWRGIYDLMPNKVYLGFPVEIKVTKGVSK